MKWDHLRRNYFLSDILIVTTDLLEHNLTNWWVAKSSDVGMSNKISPVTGFRYIL